MTDHYHHEDRQVSMNDQSLAQMIVSDPIHECSLAIIITKHRITTCLGEI